MRMNLDTLADVRDALSRAPLLGFHAATDAATGRAAVAKIGNGKEGMRKGGEPPA